MKRAARFPVALALLSAALFGSATPASKYLLHDLSPFALAGLLYLGAAIAVAPRALPGRTWRLDRRNAARLGGAVLFGGALGPVFLLLGLRLASAASDSMWLNLEMVATAVLGALLFRDHWDGSRGSASPAWCSRARSSPTRRGPRGRARGSSSRRRACAGGSTTT